MQRYFDSLKEVLFYYCGLILAGGFLFSLVESKSLLDSLWWAVVTATSTGYGDILPATILGKVVGVFVMNIGILAIVPLITAHIASKLIVDSDTFTHQEQEDLKRQVRELHEALVEKNREV